MFAWFKDNWGLAIRWFLYVSIAILTAILGETATSSLPTFWAVGLKALLQGLIAWRAFMDESMAWSNINARKKAAKDKESA